jgi:hypothetical protein
MEEGKVSAVLDDDEDMPLYEDNKKVMAAAEVIEGDEQLIP